MSKYAVYFLATSNVEAMAKFFVLPSPHSRNFVFALVLSIVPVRGFQEVEGQLTVRGNIGFAVECLEPWLKLGSSCNWVLPQRSNGTVCRCPVLLTIVTAHPMPPHRSCKGDLRIVTYRPCLYPYHLGCPTYRCWTGCPLARALLTQHCPDTSEHPVHVAMRGRADQRIRLALPSSHCTLCNAWASVLQQLTLPARFRSLALARVSGFSRPPGVEGRGRTSPKTSLRTLRLAEGTVPQHSLKELQPRRAFTGREWINR